MPDVETRSVGVSFPSQIGFSTYDLETVDQRKPVGKAFAVQRESSKDRLGEITIVLFEVPITIVFEGIFTPRLVEVWRNDVLIGKIEGERDGALYSYKGPLRLAEMRLEDNSVRFHCGESERCFPLQLDLDFPYSSTSRSKAEG